jgi:hypothetical protein
MRVGRREVQTAVRGLLTIWGLPGEMRVDNGAPWGSWGDLPPDLALWLIGLGVDMLWNRPRHKQGNAVVERAHGVLQHWSEPESCADAATLHQRLAALTTLQRDRLPVRAGQSRLALYPALASGGRPYDPAREAELFDERRVWAALGRDVRQRRVDKVGRISVYNRSLTVGRPWAGQTVTVRLVVQEESPLWVIADERGQPLATHPATELSRERILNLEVSHRRTRRPKAKPAVRKEAYPCAR